MRLNDKQFTDLPTLMNMDTSVKALKFAPSFWAAGSVESAQPLLGPKGRALDRFLSINDAWHHVAGEDELALQEMNTDAADRPVFRGHYFALEYSNSYFDYILLYTFYIHKGNKRMEEADRMKIH